MNRPSTLLAVLAVFAAGPVARAGDEDQLEFLEYPAAFCVGRADAVVVARVTKIGKDAVDLKSEWDPSKTVAHRVAVLEVETGLDGAKPGDRLKVAFPVEPPAVSGRASEVDGPLPVVLTDGQSGLFYLSRRTGDSGYYVAPASSRPVAASSTRYDREIAAAKAAVAAIADPKRALTAPGERDRLAAGCAVVERTYWRDRKPLPAELTRLVVKTVLESDWDRPGDLRDRIPYVMSGPGVASSLDLRPGRRGVPEVARKKGESPTDAWKRAVATWYDKAGDDLEIRPYGGEK